MSNIIIDSFSRWLKMVLLNTRNPKKDNCHKLLKLTEDMISLILGNQLWLKEAIRKLRRTVRIRISNPISQWSKSQNCIYLKDQLQPCSSNIMSK